MQRTLEKLLIRDHFPQKKIAFLVGPRQVGKTTLARHLLEKRNSIDLYRNWDDLEWRKEISLKPYGFLDSYRPRQAVCPLVVLDEIHKFPRWKKYLKGLWDTRKNLIDILVTGSGRLDIYQRGGDSLLGRYHQYRLHPLSVKEVVDPLPPSPDYHPDETLNALLNASGPPDSSLKEAFSLLLKWGGFPDPFLNQKTQTHRLWLKERRQLIVTQDLRDLTRIQLLSHVEQLVELLALRAGSLLSYNSLREELQVALDSIRLWIRYLEQLYFIYLIRPYAGKISRALKREPKLYLWDWSEITDEGTRFENLIASHLLKWCHFTQDWGHSPLELHFVRDKEKREVDFLVTKEKKPWILIEAKLNETTPSSALHHFSKQLGIKHRFLVTAHLSEPGFANGNIPVIDAPHFCALLPV